MPASPSPLDPELLLSQSGWVRALVRRLIRDEALAEEVVQDTWLAALERRPAGEVGGLRAWLGAVARNLALRSRRRELVRRAVERAGAQSERVPGGQDEVERMQLQQRLASAVLALEEPYRSAVIARHLDGLSNGELARRQGCTVEAARQRVARGLAQLRARLTDEFGDRAAWCAALVRLAGPSWSGAALAAGGIAMGAKLAVGVTAAALAAWTLWAGWGREEHAPAASTTEVGTAPELAPEAAALAPALAPAARVEAGAERDGQRTLGAPALPREVRGVVVTRGGEPIEGARVECAGATTVASDELGGFVLALAEPTQSPVHLVVAHDDCVTLALDVEPTRAARIVLQSLPVLRGQLRTPSGEPVAPPARVMVEVETAGGLERRYAVAHGPGEFPADSAGMGTLDAHGRFRFALPEGRLVTLWGRARGFQPNQMALDLPLAPDEETLLDVTLDAGAVLTGVVLDAVTRAPVPGAEVWAESFAPHDDELAPSTLADAFGRFRLEGVEESLRPLSDGSAALWFMLLARAEGYAPIPSRVSRAEPSEAHAYDFEVLVEPVSAVLHGLVRTADGAPAARAGVFAVGSQGNPLSVVADEQGEFTLAGVSPGTLGLWLSTGEAALATELAIGAGEQHAEFVLRTGTARLEGRVLALDGRPAAGVRVAANFTFRANGIAIRLGASECLTDAQGNYALDGLQDGAYGVEVVTQGTALPCAAPRQASVEVASARVARADFLIGPCYTLEGRIDAPGPMEALTLQAVDPDTGAYCASARIEPDGSFRFEPMLAREHEIVLSRGQDELQRTTAGPEVGEGLVLSVPR